MQKKFERKNARSSEPAIPAAIMRRSGSPSSVSRAVIERDNATTIIVPAELVAAGLGLSIETFIANLRAGLVYEITEKGVAEDSGCFRLIFRFRSRQFRVLIDDAGAIEVY
jgi:hypothetical protein